MIFMKNLRFSSCPGAKVRRQGQPGSARAQPWLLLTCFVGNSLDIVVLSSSRKRSF